MLAKMARHKQSQLFFVRLNALLCEKLNARGLPLNTKELEIYTQRFVKYETLICNQE